MRLLGRALTGRALPASKACCTVWPSRPIATRARGSKTNRRSLIAANHVNGHATLSTEDQNAGEREDSEDRKEKEKYAAAWTRNAPLLRSSLPLRLDACTCISLERGGNAHEFIYFQFKY